MTLIDGYAALETIEKHLSSTDVDTTSVRECFQKVRWADFDLAAGRQVDAAELVEAGYRLLALLAEAATVVDAMRGDDE